MISCSGLLVLCGHVVDAPRCSQFDISNNVSYILLYLLNRTFMYSLAVSPSTQWLLVVLRIYSCNGISICFSTQRDFLSMGQFL